MKQLVKRVHEVGSELTFKELIDISNQLKVPIELMIFRANAPDYDYDGYGSPYLEIEYQSLETDEEELVREQAEQKEAERKARVAIAVLKRKETIARKKAGLI